MTFSRATAIFAAVLLGVAVLSVTDLMTCATEPAPQAPAGRAGQPAEDHRAEVIHVKTAEQFVTALGSDREIHLAAGEYVLTDVKDRQMDAVRWDRKFDGLSLTVRNVKNLSLVGEGDKPVRLIVRPGYVFVLNFEKCDAVRLENLSMGHAPQKGECDSGVLGATDCAGLTFHKCDLFGCGTEGLTLKDVAKLSFEDSTIRDCTYGILTAEGCRDLSFTRSRFTGNEQFWGMQFNDTKTIAFADCVVEGNKAGDQSLFQLTSSSAVRFEGGAIRKNAAAGLTDRPDQIEVRGAAVEQNHFEKARR